MTPDVARIVAHIDGTAPAAGEEFTPSIDNIEARTLRKHLEGGIDAALLAKKTRAGKVQLDLRLHYGDARSLRGKEIAGEMAASLLSRGTRKHDLQALRDLADKLEADISIWGGVDELDVHVETFRAKLPQVLDLIGEELTSPSFPGRQLEIVRRERLARLQEQAVDPSARARRALARLTHPWPKGDPRYVMTYEEEIAAVKRVSLGEIRAFYRGVMGAGHGEVAVVGDFDPAAVSAQLEHVFAGWQSKKPYARLDDKVFPVAGGTTTIDTPDKKMAQLRVGAEVAMRDDDPDYPAWLMLGKILGGDTGARIWMRLREHEGLSYGAFAWTSADALDKVGWIGGSAIVAPENLARARASLLDEFGKMARGKVGDDELARARQAWSLELHTRLARDGYVSSQLAGDLYLHRTLEWQRQLEAKILAVDAGRRRPGRRGSK